MKQKYQSRLPVRIRIPGLGEAGSYLHDLLVCFELIGAISKLFATWHSGFDSFAFSNSWHVSPMPKDEKHVPRKLPSQLRSKATVDAIFEATLQVLAKAESDAPAVEKIADRAGVSVGSLYQYFRSKDSLVSALIGFHLKQRLAVLKTDLESVRGLEAEQAASLLVDKLLVAMVPRLSVERSLIRYFCRVGDLGNLTEMDGEMNSLVEDFLRSLKDSIRPVDVSLAAFIVLNALRSAVLLTMMQHPQRLSDPQFAQELKHLVISYLKK
jgi:AcrR family transcriptional regulator